MAYLLEKFRDYAIEVRHMLRCGRKISFSTTARENIKRYKEI